MKVSLNSIEQRLEALQAKHNEAAKNGKPFNYEAAQRRLRALQRRTASVAVHAVRGWKRSGATSKSTELSATMKSVFKMIEVLEKQQANFK